PADAWAMIPTLAGLYVDGVNKSALQKAKIPTLGGVDMYHTAAVVTHTVGPQGGSPQVDATVPQNTTYDASGATNSQNLATKGWTAAAAARLKRGDVFVITGVYAVNPMTKQVLPYQQQFVVNADFNSLADGTGAVNISPAIITSGPYQTVS